MFKKMTCFQDEKKKEWEQKMKQMEARIIYALEERLPKCDNVTQGTHENKGIKSRVNNLQLVIIF
jgi:hypothetical protein